MKKEILSILFLFIALGLSAQFRSTEWGMSREAVKNTEETAPIDESEDGLMYQVDIASLECYIIYFIANDQLYQAGYTITENHSNANKYIDDFTKLKELLTKKYSEPNIDRIYWEDDSFKDNVANRGLAISMGHLFFHCIWDSEDTEISLSLAGDNFNINHYLIYKNKTLSEKQDEIREEEVLEQL